MKASAVSGRVLLVDDSPLILEILRDGLSEHGWEVEVAESGVDALAMARLVSFEAVVCDLHMPGLNGIEVMNRLALIDPSLPVIILSAEDDLKEVLRAVREGAFDYVLKADDDITPLAAAVTRATSHVRVLRENAHLSGALRATNAELADRLAELDQRMVELRSTEEELRQVNTQLEAARDQALGASRAKSLFLASMSHELRTPLNAIIGYSELIQEEAEELRITHFDHDLTKIQDAGRHLLALLNDILDLSKIEAGKMELFVESFDVGGLIREVASTIQPLIASNENQFEVVSGSHLGIIQSDKTKLRQVLFNLLSNASKFTERGRIRLDVDRLTRPSGDWLIFDVHDTGIGMTRDQVTRLFQDFVQAEAGTTRKYGGTGLGLAISKRFVELMGGDITVESMHGKGSTFSVHLPVTAADPSKKRIDRSKPARRTLYQRTILVIDDDINVCDMMSRHLAKEGFRVVTTNRGEDGLRIAREIHPDAITLDVLMPGLDGWSVLSALKADHRLAEIPVVMLSMLNDKNMAYSLGATEYLTKPVDRSRLTQVLDRLHKDRPPVVLVVEDSGTMRDLFKQAMLQQGCEVETAANGRLALEVLERRPVDLILLDLMMPEMDGFEFLDRLADDSSWIEVPVVTVTAVDLTQQERLRLSGSVQAILPKSEMGLEELVKQIQLLLTQLLKQDGAPA